MKFSSVLFVFSVLSVSTTLVAAHPGEYSKTYSKPHPTPAPHKPKDQCQKKDIYCCDDYYAPHNSNGQGLAKHYGVAWNPSTGVGSECKAVYGQNGKYSEGYSTCDASLLCCQEIYHDGAITTQCKELALDH